MNQISNIHATHSCTAREKNWASAHAVTGQKIFLGTYAYPAEALKIFFLTSADAVARQKISQQAIAHSALVQNIFFSIAADAATG